MMTMMKRCLSLILCCIVAVCMLPQAANAETGYARITVEVRDVWGDGSGYQLLLDSTARAYGNQISPTANSIQASAYRAFDQKLPANANGNMASPDSMINTSATFEVPAGVYDGCFANPTPGSRIYIASNNGNFPGRFNNYQFEKGKAYTFTISFDAAKSQDRIDMTVSTIEDRIVFTQHPKSITVARGQSGYYLQASAKATNGQKVTYKWFYCDAKGFPNGEWYEWIGTGEVFDIPTNLRKGKYRVVCQANAEGLPPVNSNIATINVGPKIPNTGDSNHPAIYAALMALSLAGVVILMKKRVRA